MFNYLTSFLVSANYLHPDIKEYHSNDNIHLAPAKHGQTCCFISNRGFCHTRFLHFLRHFIEWTGTEYSDRHG